MKDINIFSTSIHTVLRDLIETKSRRDNIKFTGYQLANALKMPRSIITKLTHPDESKRIVNPKLETLLKIIEYFKMDGFNVSMDMLLGFTNRSLDIQAQPVVPSESIQSISLYCMNNIKHRLGTIDIKLRNSIDESIALYLEADMEPCFKAGSIFIVDLNIKPSNNTLIAVKLANADNVQIKKFFKEKHKIVLKSLDVMDKDIILQPTNTFNIIGVVVQINAKS